MIKKMIAIIVVMVVGVVGLYFLFNLSLEASFIITLLAIVIGLILAKNS